MARASASDSALRPSSVVMERPSTRAAGTEQLSTGSPSSHTVHRPQLVVSQAQRTDAQPCSRSSEKSMVSGAI